MWQGQTSEGMFFAHLLIIYHITSEIERSFPNAVIPILQVSYFMSYNIHKLNESVLGSMDQCSDLPCKE